MIRRVLTALSLTLLLAGLAGCPETSKEIGHAPKRQIDKAQKAADKAEKTMADKARSAAKAAEAAHAADGIGE